ncbi:MAG: hypothetical protein HY720_24205 [Planctomycetes bacterium]|nr:hypothetical protein [Planctomycetota bacterium]
MTLWRLEVLSPLHIGTGRAIDASECIREPESLAILDEGEAFAGLCRMGAEPALALAERRLSLGEALESAPGGASEALAGGGVRYRVGVPASCAEIVASRRFSIHEAVKAAGREPLVPGTSLKGALRTTILWDLVRRAASGDPPRGFDDFFEKARAYLLVVLSARRLARDLAERSAETNAWGAAPFAEYLASEEFRLRHGFRVGPDEVGFVLEELRFPPEATAAGRPGVERVREALEGIASWGPSRIGQELARLAFGPTPTQDLLRGLRVTDSLEASLPSLPGGGEQPPPPSDRRHGFRVAKAAPAAPSPSWRIFAARIYSIAGVPARPIAKSASPDLYECLPPGASFTIEVASILEDEDVDPAARAEWLRESRCEGRLCLLEDIPGKCRARSRSQIEDEIVCCERALAGTEYLAFHRRLLERLESDDQSFLLRLGGKNGWNRNTVTSLLGDDVVAALRAHFRLGKFEEGTDAEGRSFVRAIDPFPKTRHVVVEEDRPMMPFGWVAVTV